MLVCMIFVLMSAWLLACHARSQMVGSAMSSAPPSTWWPFEPVLSSLAGTGNRMRLLVCSRRVTERVAGMPTCCARPQMVFALYPTPQRLCRASGPALSTC